MPEQKKMKINVEGVSFAFTEKFVFNGLNAKFDELDGPLVILGPSGSGKTTFLKLLGGLLKPLSGDINFLGEGEEKSGAPLSAFMFQEPRLLPWLTVLENVSIPLEKTYGKEGAKKRALDFLSLVSLEEKEKVFPVELSGGEAQRVSMARAFSWNAPVLLMDEPFQSLDIPLRKNLMDLTLSLLEKEKRFLAMVTHDPREAVYLGGRVIVLGRPGEGIVFDRVVDNRGGKRSYGSSESESAELVVEPERRGSPPDLEKEIIDSLITV
jgi:ABC-type nitrate/sulfonate/bicarbonate transport system ATPase subunit